MSQDLTQGQTISANSVWRAALTPIVRTRSDALVGMVTFRIAGSLSQLIMIRQS
jgi:hypothetical protein